MNNVNMKAKRLPSDYEITARIGNRMLALKYDTGAKYTVISVGAFDKSLAEKGLETFKAYCEEHCSNKYKGDFISATGDPFKGYLITAHDVKIGNNVLRDFRYYLVVENKRDIALLGFDFIDKCKRSADAYGDILITAFDGYGKLDGVMENDEVMAYIDSLGVNGLD